MRKKTLTAVLRFLLILAFLSSPLISEGTERHFYWGIGAKFTKIYGEYAILIGGNTGVNINRTFSVGAAVYGRVVSVNESLEIDVDFDHGEPAYGGMTFGYSVSSNRRVYIQAQALFGLGNTWGRTFFIFEPEIDLVLNLSRFTRIKLGLSMPFTDNDYSGLENPIFNVGFQFGR